MVHQSLQCSQTVFSHGTVRLVYKTSITLTCYGLLPPYMYFLDYICSPCVSELLMNSSLIFQSAGSKLHRTSLIVLRIYLTIIFIAVTFFPWINFSKFVYHLNANIISCSLVYESAPLRQANKSYASLRLPMSTTKLIAKKSIQECLFSLERKDPECFPLCTDVCPVQPSSSAEELPETAVKAWRDALDGLAFKSAIVVF